MSDFALMLNPHETGFRDVRYVFKKTIHCHTMIDVKSLRENPKAYYESCKSRDFDTKLLDDFFDLDIRWRERLKEINGLKHEKNELSLRIADFAKKGEDAGDLKYQVKILNSKILEIEDGQKTIEAEREKLVRLIPNLIDNDVPRCKGDENSTLLRVEGTPKVYADDLQEFRSNSGNSDNFILIEKKPRSHVDLAQELGLVDLERAAKVSGARFYYLKNRLVKLEQALISYSLDFLSERGYDVVEPPFMLNLKAYEGATDMDTFQEMLYKMENEDLYLIGTAEHPLAALYMDEILEPDQLPIRMAGVSPCFRREAGAHGKDTKGIFRVHQFFKVEQFVFCKPEHSWEFFAEILGNAEQIFKNLGLPYRVINICSGDLGSLAARKNDIEVWFPSQGKYREVVSASNDTDYQARSLNIRYRTPDGNKVPHTLNSTAVASTRTLVAIIENYQDEDGNGFSIPEVLVPYTGFDHIGK